MQDTPASQAERHAKWVAVHDIADFQQLLNTQTEEGKYSILAQLLSHEFAEAKDVQRL